MIISRTNVASVGSVFNGTRKVKVLLLPETIKEKSTFRAKSPRRELVVETSIFRLSFQVVIVPVPFAYHSQGRPFDSAAVGRIFQLAHAVLV